MYKVAMANSTATNFKKKTKTCTKRKSKKFAAIHFQGFKQDYRQEEHVTRVHLHVPGIKNANVTQEIRMKQPNQQ